jgi:hypothetical protein
VPITEAAAPISMMRAAATHQIPAGGVTATMGRLHSAARVPGK